MTDIKHSLLEAADQAPGWRKLLTAAHDHIAAQDKRIAELEVHINQAVKSILRLQSDQFDAIDADRYRIIRDAACSDEKMQCVFFDVADAIGKNKPMTPALFDASTDAAGVAMKAAK